MRMSEAFPSNYLRASDFPKPTLLTISHVKMEDIGDDHKPVLYFQELDKGLCLNKTNGNTIADVYGDDSDDWKGQQIVAFETPVQFQGRMVQAVRVRKPKPQAKPHAPLPPAPLKKANDIDPPDDMNDDIPF